MNPNIIAMKSQDKNHSHIILNLHFHTFIKYLRIECLRKQQISHQAHVTVISFERMSDALSPSILQVFLAGTLHAKVI